MSRLAFALVSATVLIPARQPQAYSTTFYPSGSLRIEAYVYRPTGSGSFPVVIYSHGSRKNYEREERPMAFVGNMLASQGYLVLVPERRGYGKSDGRTFTEEVGSDVGGKMIARLEAEADDVLAAITYVATIDGADLSRLALVGFSQGGSVSIRVASKRSDVRALVDQAGGSLTWPRSPDLRRALTDWAKTLKMPVLCMDAANDATTDAVKAVCDAAHRGGADTRVTIYPAFTPASNPDNIAPGHLIFAPGAGVAIWRQDVISFLAANTARGRQDLGLPSARRAVGRVNGGLHRSGTGTEPKHPALRTPHLALILTTVSGKAEPS